MYILHHAHTGLRVPGMHSTSFHSLGGLSAQDGAGVRHKPASTQVELRLILVEELCENLNIPDLNTVDGQKHAGVPTLPPLYSYQPSRTFLVGNLKINLRGGKSHV